MTVDVEISCIVPAFESGDLLAPCLDSITAQAGVALEVILMDDSRTPGGQAEAERLARTSPLIRYVEGARTGNPVDNWNAGLSLVRGRYVSVVHHDERLADPGFLRRAMDALEAKRGGVFVGRCSVAGGRRPGAFALTSAVARWLRPAAWTLYAVNWIGPTAAVVVAADVRERFDPGLRWLVDVDFYSRAMRRGPLVLCHRARSVLSEPHSQQITAALDVHKLRLDELKVLAKTHPGYAEPWQQAVLTAYAAVRAAIAGRA